MIYLRALTAGSLLGCLLIAGCGSSSRGDEAAENAGATATGGDPGLAGTGGQPVTQVGTGGGSGPSAIAGGAGSDVSGGGSQGGFAQTGGTGGMIVTGGGMTGTGGVGGVGGGMSGTGGAGGATTNEDYLKTSTKDYGFVQLAASSNNQILSFTTTLAVPVKPGVNTGTLFLWPGLQPGGANYEPIDNGVLQPVLTWGPTCAPNSPKSAYASWWVSGQYVNTYGKEPGYTDCHGGEGMNVNVGDQLLMVMALTGTVWHQAVTDSASQKSVSYDLDLHGQAQNYAEFDIEIYTEDPAADIIFGNTQVVLEKSQPKFCQPTTRGINDFFTNPHMSADGKTCTIERIVLRAKGVPATSPN